MGRKWCNAVNCSLMYSYVFRNVLFGLICFLNGYHGILFLPCCVLGIQIDCK
jgi:hypothetical protein